MLLLKGLLLYFFTVTLLLLSVATPAKGQTCRLPNSPEKTRVYFVNGMQNTRAEAENSLLLLTNLINAHFTEVELSYNFAEFIPLQIAEVLRQRKEEPTDYWGWSGNLAKAPNKYLQAYAQVISRHATREFFTDDDLQLMISDYLVDLQSGKKVLLVAHSQGNFYANNAYQFITQTFPHYTNSMSIISMGTPSGRVLGNGAYHTNEFDKVINFIRPFFNVLTANFSFRSAADNSGHQFSQTYLNARGSNLLSDLLSLDALLQSPQRHPDCDLTASVTTLPATSIKPDSAVLRARLEKGAKSNVWFEYGVSSRLNCSVPNPSSPNEFNAPQTLEFPIDNLVQSIKYFYRACAIGQDGLISSGSVKNFTTVVETVKCGESYQGGTNGLRVIVDFRPKLRNLDAPVLVEFEAFQIPDAVNIYSFPRRISQPLWSTGGLISGFSGSTFTLPWQDDRVEVIVTGNTDIDTAWELNISCPNYP